MADATYTYIYAIYSEKLYAEGVSHGVVSGTPGSYVLSPSRGLSTAGTS